MTKEKGKRDGKVKSHTTKYLGSQPREACMSGVTWGTHMKSGGSSMDGCST